MGSVIWDNDPNPIIAMPFTNNVDTALSLLNQIIMVVGHALLVIWAVVLLLLLLDFNYYFIHDSFLLQRLKWL